VINTRAFLDDLRNSIQAGLEGAGYRAIFQPSQSWAGSFQASSSSSQGGVTLFYGKVCEHCGETLAYRVISARGASAARVTIPKDCDAATAAGCLVREILPLLTNRLPAAKRHDPGVGAGLLSSQESGRLAASIESRGVGH
jgi:hypothetical protein